MSRRIKKRAADESEVNLTPMLDIVFIMLIFFIVTATFVRERGLEGQNPDDSDPPVNPPPAIIIAVDQSNNIFVEDQGRQRQVDVRAVRANVSRKLAENRKSAVVIQADAVSDMGVVVRVMDQAKLANAPAVSIALQGG
jgi:biopolymer transport protein ExbD